MYREPAAAIYVSSNIQKEKDEKKNCVTQNAQDKLDAERHTQDMCKEWVKTDCQKGGWQKKERKTKAVMERLCQTRS